MFENKLGFSENTKGNHLLTEFQQKIDAGKLEIKELKSQLNSIPVIAPPPSEIAEKLERKREKA